MPTFSTESRYSAWPDKNDHQDFEGHYSTPILRTVQLEYNSQVQFDCQYRWVRDQRETTALLPSIKKASSQITFAPVTAQDRVSGLPK